MLACFTKQRCSLFNQFQHRGLIWPDDIQFGQTATVPETTSLYFETHWFFLQILKTAVSVSVFDVFSTTPSPFVYRYNGNTHIRRHPGYTASAFPYIRAAILCGEAGWRDIAIFPGRPQYGLLILNLLILSVGHPLGKSSRTCPSLGEVVLGVTSSSP